MVILMFFFFRLEIFFVKLVQMFKIVSLTWNLIPRLFEICEIWWWCSFFFVLELFCKFFSFLGGHFCASWFISQEITHSNLKPLTFLVLIKILGSIIVAVGNLELCFW